MGNLCWKEIQIGQLCESVHLQAREGISKLVINTWNMLRLKTMLCKLVDTNLETKAINNLSLHDYLLLMRTRDSLSVKTH